MAKGSASALQLQRQSKWFQTIWYACRRQVDMDAWAHLYGFTDDDAFELFKVVVKIIQVGHLPYTLPR